MDRRAFLAAIGGAGALELMTSEEKAEALEAAMIREQNRNARPSLGRENGEEELPEMPERPTLVDFYRLRIAPAQQHSLQSGAHALEVGMPERTVFACLLHDIAVTNLVRADHGYWCAQLIEPYVDERVSWAIRYHQSLRFFPDPDVGYEYPEMYNRMFGEDYVPEPYIKKAHEYAKKHAWYMEARQITMNDEYAFDPDKKAEVDTFVEILERNFKNPPEGLGFDGSPSAHMWRTIANPKRPL